MKSIIISVLLLFIFFGCATHIPYNTAQFRERAIEPKEISLDKDGLTRDQIDAISSTKPPSSFPVDISIVLLKNGYIDSKVEDIFARNLIQEIAKSENIDRVTLIPDFIVPNAVDFNSIQELGVRSLSEYIIVIYLDSREFFNWTKIIETKFEINSSITFIIVDSYTAAMLTSDKLYSTQEYKKRMFELEEQRKAQKIIFTEQAKLLAKKLSQLFKPTVYKDGYQVDGHASFAHPTME